MTMKGTIEQIGRQNTSTQQGKLSTNMRAFSRVNIQRDTGKTHSRTSEHWTLVTDQQ